MKRNSILALGFGLFLGVGMLTPGCGDSGGGTHKDASGDATSDAKRDTGATGGSTARGGATGTGGAVTTGGATGSGGATGAGGATSAGGAGGTTSTGGNTGTAGMDGGVDGPAGKLDTNRDSSDAADVPLPGPETGAETGTVQMDTAGLDGGMDQAGLDGGVMLDSAIDQADEDAPAIDASEMDAEGTDADEID
jgi:hypothetical protein